MTHQFTLRLPTTLWTALGKYAKRRGLTNTAAAIVLLRSALGLED